MSDDRPDPVESTRFEDALAQGLRDRPRPPSGPCPDAEVLAAFSEDSLSTSDRQESHLAACVSCQAHIAALIRTDGIEPEVTQPTTSWWLDWRWLAPLVATSVVLLAVWAIDPTSVGDSGVEMEKTAPAPLDGGAGNELREASDAGDELREVSYAVRQERAIDDERTALLLSRDQASPAEADSALVLEEVATPALQTRQVAGDPSPAPADTALADASPPAAAAERRLDNLALLSSTASPQRNRAINSGGGVRHRSVRRDGRVACNERWRSGALVRWRCHVDTPARKHRVGTHGGVGPLGFGLLAGRSQRHHPAHH